MGVGAWNFNVVCFGCANPDEYMFEAWYNEEENFLANKDNGYCSNYPKYGGNQSWATDEGWKDREH